MIAHSAVPFVFIKDDTSEEDKARLLAMSPGELLQESIRIAVNLDRSHDVVVDIIRGVDIDKKTMFALIFEAMTKNYVLRVKYYRSVIKYAVGELQGIQRSAAARWSCGCRDRGRFARLRNDVINECDALITKLTEYMETIEK